VADFRIWGTIHQVAPQQFAVTVSAVPDPASEQIEYAVVDAITVSSRELAVEACADLVPGEGIEPSWCCHRGILSPVRLPIPPSRR
jgi:hypothetical protein